MSKQSETTLQTFVHSLWAKKHSLESGRLWIVWEQMVCRPVSIGSQWKLSLKRAFYVHA